MCTEQDIRDAVEQELWHNTPDHIHSVVDSSGPHASIGTIDVELDYLDDSEETDEEGGVEDDEATFLDANGNFTGTAHISVEGSYGKVPSRIDFKGRCVDGRIQDLEFEWVEDEEASDL